MDSPAFSTISSDAQFAAWIDRLEASGVREVGLDFEGEFNLHVYGNHLCLVQVFDGRELTIIDPFKVGPEQLRRFLEHPEIAKIIYDCASDGALVAEVYGIKLGPVIDLKLAADLLDYPRRDLGTVLSVELGVTVEKKKQFQMYNWMNRPLRRDALEYALNDVLELMNLRDALVRRLTAEGKLDAWHEANSRHQPDGQRKNRTPRLFKSREYFMLDKTGKASFEALFNQRDRIARDLNLPPAMVVDNAALFDLARGRIGIEAVRFNRRMDNAGRRRVETELGPLARRD